MEVAENDSQDLSNNCKILGLERGKKTAKFLIINFAYRSIYYLFYGLHNRRVDALLKRDPSNLNKIYHAYISI
jgi:hypothetical protein